jgi:hypothetical protein
MAWTVLAGFKVVKELVCVTGAPVAPRAVAVTV